MGPTLRFEQRHEVSIPVAGRASRGVAHPSLDDEPDVLIARDGSRIEVVHAELEAMEAETVETERHELLH